MSELVLYIDGHEAARTHPNRLLDLFAEVPQADQSTVAGQVLDVRRQVPSHVEWQGNAHRYRVEHLL